MLSTLLSSKYDVKTADYWCPCQAEQQGLIASLLMFSPVGLIRVDTPHLRLVVPHSWSLVSPQELHSALLLH